MDSKLPEISVEAPRGEKKDEKKRGGLLGLLNFFGKGSSSFSGALGGAGLGGGLLATKAGIVALILVGTTLAGGLGVIGYKVFGPGASDSADAKFSSLFASKPKDQQEAEARAAAANGDSTSLDDLAKANSGALNGPQQPGADASAGATTDKTKQDAAAIAAAAAGAAGAKGKGKDNNTNVGGNKAASLKTDRKFGELSKLGGASGGGSGSGASFSNAAVGPGHARLGGFAVGPSANLGGAKASSRARKFGGAFDQLKGQAAIGKGNGTMMGSGGVFDGNAATPAGIGGNGSQALGGAGTNGNPAPTGGGATNTPGLGQDGSRFAQPPPATPTNVTPWQAAINTAVMCVAAAAALLYFMGKVAKMPDYGTALAYVMAAIAAALGAFVVYLGSMIGGSFYGQHLQGQMFELAGTAIIATAGVAAMGVSEMAKTGEPTMLMYLCGALALGAAAVGYLTPPRQVPSTDFTNGNPPDWDNKNPQETCQGNAANCNNNTATPANGGTSLP